MMADKESVQPAMDKSDTPTHSVDYYYLEAMRYLSCSAHHSDDSDGDNCNCRRCHSDNNDEESSNGSGQQNNDNEISSGRERSWSHSMADDFESGTISQLPNLNGKTVGGRLKNRRFSDGMLLKPNMKVTNGHVTWADDCKKELTRSRPRKTYTRNPALKPTPVKSILKNPSQESLVIPENSDYSSNSDED